MKKLIFRKYNKVKIIKNKTLNEDLCKQYFIILNEENLNENVLHIKKYILSDKKLEQVELIKEFKNKKLYFSQFAIKLKTLEEAINWIINQ